MGHFNKQVADQPGDSFPFDVKIQPDQVILDIVAADVFWIYEPLFEAEGLYGNGTGWEGLISQALSRLRPELLDAIEFDSEADCCRIFVPDELAAFDLVNTLRPHLTDEVKLRSLLKEIDLDQIDA